MEVRCGNGHLDFHGNVGDAYDNAMAQSFFASLECELINRHSWPTKREVRFAVFTWIEDYYNPRRRHQPKVLLRDIHTQHSHQANEWTVPLTAARVIRRNGFFTQ
jgi:putative transposase